MNIRGNHGLSTYIRRKERLQINDIGIHLKGEINSNKENTKEKAKQIKKMEMIKLIAEIDEMDNKVKH